MRSISKLIACRKAIITDYIPRTPILQKLSNRGVIYIFYCALKRIKLNVILFSGGETPPLRLKRIYCRGRRPRRPNCIVCRKTIFERTMYAKTLPSVKFFGVTFFSKKVTKNPKHKLTKKENPRRGFSLFLCSAKKFTLSCVLRTI